MSRSRPSAFAALDVDADPVAPPAGFAVPWVEQGFGDRSQCLLPRPRSPGALGDAGGARRPRRNDRNIHDTCGGILLGVSQPTDQAIAQSRLERLHEATSRLHGCTTRAEAYDVVLGTGVDVLGFDWCCLAEAADDMFELVAVSDGAPVTVG